jgi:hypothetical protein
MNTFSRVAIAMVGMTGLATAQPKTEAPKADATKAGGQPDMSPPAELAATAKMAGGTWHCKGQGMDHTMKMVDTTATMTVKLDVNNWWLHGTFESRMGKEPFRFESFSTFDPKTKKWSRVMVESGGNWASGESAGMKDNKVDWELTTHSAMMGDGMFRDHEDMSDAKAGVKLWGEFSPDKGKTWTKIYELTCKK